MNLEEVIDPEYGLQQDEWSLSKPVFGDEGQLEVVGWSGRSGYNKYYILKCSVCGKDSKLFGGGYFRSGRGELAKGKLPCGCGRHPRWSKEQYEILCSRKAKELGYEFLGFIDEWKGAFTKIKKFCQKHGEWQKGCIADLVNQGKGCPGCRRDILMETNTKPDSVMKSSFFKSGAFHPETKFWRSQRKNASGSKNYWHVFCPECGEQGESTSGCLQRGRRPCSCSPMRQKEAYINYIIDKNIPIGIKFGIANSSKQRIKVQDSKTEYQLKQHLIYIFPDTSSCKAAERECKQTLECGVVLKRDMPDGYTETTWLYNLDKIKAIYEKHGGLEYIDEKKAIVS